MENDSLDLEKKILIIEVIKGLQTGPSLTTERCCGTFFTSLASLHGWLSLISMMSLVGNYLTERERHLTHLLPL